MLVVSSVGSAWVWEVGNRHRDTPRAVDFPWEGGTHDHPAPMQHPIVVDRDDCQTRLTVTDAIRGERANQLIMRVDPLNPAPEPGHEYLLVQVRINHTGADQAMHIGPANFAAVSNETEYDETMINMPGNMTRLQSTQMQPGTMKTGWIAYQVPENQTMLLAYKQPFQQTVYVSLNQTGSPMGQRRPDDQPPMGWQSRTWMDMPESRFDRPEMLGDMRSYMRMNWLNR